MKTDWTRRRIVAAYVAFAVVAFVLSLRWTFPAEAMKERLIMEAGRRGWQIDVEKVSAGGLLGVRARGVKLETASGLAIPIEDLTASLRILPLLVGRRSIAFEADLYDGRVRGTADLSGDPRDVVVDVQGVDLGRALPLRKAAGVDLLGVLTGKAELSMPAAADGRPTGRVDLTVKDAGISGGQLPIPAIGGGLPLPKTGLGAVVVAVKLADGKGTFEKLEATGGDAELRTEGVSFVVQPRMEFAPISGKARLKVADAFWGRSGLQGFKGLADAALASSKGSDGSWNLTVTGSVGHPRLNPSGSAR
jgi:type II secretion system protein N